MAAAALIGLALFGLRALLDLDDRGDHIAWHLNLTIPVLLILAALLTLWPPPPPHWLDRLARVTLAIGIVVFICGQLLEIIGASGYERKNRVSELTRVHDVGNGLAPWGLLFILVGAALSVGLRAGREAPPPRWVVLLLVGALVVFVGLVVVGRILAP